MKYRLIAIDADDTLWETQPFFDRIEEWYCAFLSKYAPADVIDIEFFKKECENMKKLGFGSKAFIISLVENAIEVTKGEVKPSELKEIIDRGRTLIDIPATPLKGVEKSLEKIRAKIDKINSQQESKVKLIIFTKGDSKEQEDKIFRSGLLKYFDDYRVYTDKRKEDYLKLTQEFSVKPEEFLMVGNSFKSDIEPVLQIGGNAIHIPFYAPWKYESTQEYDHPNLVEVEHFSSLHKILC